MKNKTMLSMMIPVMLSFFTMGFVDLVGIVTNYVKSDFALADTAANAFSVMVFLWFLVFSIPTGMLMNRIGRKKTTLLSILVTIAGLCTPSLAYSQASMFVAFSLLGIGNTLMQVSLNPLLTNIVQASRLPSYLTLGQFVKAIASFIAPIIAAQAVIHFGDWKLLFPLFALVALIALLYLYFTDIKEQPLQGAPSTFKECLGLLRNPFTLCLFLGILVHVGIDVGMNMTAPKLLIEKTGLTLAKAGYATSLYFFFRTLGCFSGAFLLARIPTQRFLIASVLAILAGTVGLFFCHTTTSIYLCVALVGVGNSNVFPIIFSRALQHLPARGNEMSGLMMMGISGGAIFPVLMGLASDCSGTQAGAVAVLTACVAYLLFLSLGIKTIKD
jgi:fucose permease